MRSQWGKKKKKNCLILTKDISLKPTATPLCLWNILCLQRTDISLHVTSLYFKAFLFFFFFFSSPPNSKHCNTIREGLMVLLFVWALIITQPSVIYNCFYFIFYKKKSKHTHGEIAKLSSYASGRHSWETVSPPPHPQPHPPLCNLQTGAHCVSSELLAAPWVCNIK